MDLAKVKLLIKELHLKECRLGELSTRRCGTS